jgi:hypothetical protein
MTIAKGEAPVERLHYAEVAAVSRYWTPEHLDVTDAPMTYARPKPAWIEQYDRRRRRATDGQDRLARHRMHSGAIVEPCEIPVLPPITVPVSASAPPARESFFANLYGAVARRLPSRRVAV